MLAGGALGWQPRALPGARSRVPSLAGSGCPYSGAPAGATPPLRGAMRQLPTLITRLGSTTTVASLASRQAYPGPVLLSWAACPAAHPEATTGPFH